MLAMNHRGNREAVYNMLHLMSCNDSHPWKLGDAIKVGEWKCLAKAEEWKGRRRFASKTPASWRTERGSASRCHTPDSVGD